METVGIFEMKVHLSEICDRVSRSKQPVLVTRRGVPLVRIEPAAGRWEATSRIWRLRDAFERRWGGLEDEITLPDRTREPVPAPLDD